MPAFCTRSPRDTGYVTNHPNFRLVDAYSVLYVAAYYVSSNYYQVPSRVACYDVAIVATRNVGTCIVHDFLSAVVAYFTTVPRKGRVELPATVQVSHAPEYIVCTPNESHRQALGPIPTVVVTDDVEIFRNQYRWQSEVKLHVRQRNHI